MGIKLQGGDNSNNLANIDSQKGLAVVTPQPLAGFSAGFVQASTEVDAGNVIETRSVTALECSDDYRVRVGVDQTLFNCSFESGSSPSHWFFTSNSTLVTGQGSGFLNLNASPTTSAGNVYFRSHRTFPVYGTYPTYLDMWIRESNPDAVNAISEWGFLYLTAAGTQQPLDGIFFRRLSGGQLKGIITSSISGFAVDIEEVNLETYKVPPRAGGLHNFDPTETNHYLIVVQNDSVRFWINDTLVGELPCAPQLAQFASSSALPIGLRVIQGMASTTASAARQVSLGYVNVGLGDQNTNKQWSHVICGMGGGAYQLFSSPSGTVTRASANTGHPASGTARSTAAWTATSAPALNNLGGLWTSPAISTLSSDADYPVFSFQNPTGSAATSGKTLYITGVRIGESFASAAASTNPIFLSYIVTVEASASATNTGDAATTTSGKSIVIGGQGFTAGDGVGSMKEGFEMTFHSPLVVPAGKYVNLIVRPFGTVTSNTLVVRGSVSFNGYFE